MNFGFFGMPGVFELLIIGVVVGIPVAVAVVVLLSTMGKKTDPRAASNLVACPDCRQGVSIRAQTCPHCGAPLKPSA